MALINGKYLVDLMMVDVFADDLADVHIACIALIYKKFSVDVMMVDVLTDLKADVRVQLSLMMENTQLAF
jgi:hypothetical protein